MSRSYRKTPIHGIAKSKSEKWYKRFRAKRERARLIVMKASGLIEEADAELAPWDEWDTGRDGKRYDHDWLLDKKSRSK